MSAALLSDGELVAAVEEERFTRVKHAAGFPAPRDRRVPGHGRRRPRPTSTTWRSRAIRAPTSAKAWFALRNRPGRGARHGPAEERRPGARRRGERLARGARRAARTAAPQIHWVEHHPAHLASAFFASPVRGGCRLRHRRLRRLREHLARGAAAVRGSRCSSASTSRTRSASSTWPSRSTSASGSTATSTRSWGSRPTGQPDFADELRRLLHLRPGGGFELDLSYFRHWSDGVSMTWDDGEPEIGRIFTAKLEALLGPARRPDEPLDATARGHRGVAPGRLRGGRRPRADAPPRADRPSTALPGRRLRHEQRDERQDPGAHAVPRASTSSPPPATTAPRSARRFTCGTRCSGDRAAS